MPSRRSILQTFALILIGAGLGLGLSRLCNWRYLRGWEDAMRYRTTPATMPLVPAE
jgi:hypothetical protein